MGKSRPASAEPWPLVDEDSDSGGPGEGGLRQHSQGTRALLVPGPHCQASGDWKGQDASAVSSVLPKYSLFAERSDVYILCGQHLQICLILLGLSSSDLRIWNPYRSLYGDGNGNPLQYSCLDIAWTRSLAGNGPWGRKRRTRQQLTPHPHRVT